MARRVKFPLKMAGGVEVRTLEQLKEHFDIDSVVEYFFDGRLLSWLEDRYYDYEADAIRALNENDDYLAENLCAIFDVETEEEILQRKLLRVIKALLFAKRLNRLKKYTDDKNILANVDKVAFDQEELADLLDEGVDEIYLCANRFVIPLRMKNKNYIGVGKAIAVIRSKEPVDFEKFNITFDKVRFDDDYQKLLPKTTAKNTQTTTKSKPFRFIDQNIPVNPPFTPKAEATTIITYKPGFHVSPSAVFVQKASTFKSTIRIKAKGKTFDAKSILMIMSMGLTAGTEITIMADGEDAKEAVDELKSLVDREFYPELGELLLKHRS